MAGIQLFITQPRFRADRANRGERPIIHAELAQAGVDLAHDHPARLCTHSQATPRDQPRYHLRADPKSSDCEYAWNKGSDSLSVQSARYVGATRRARRRSSLARPYIWRLT